MQMEADRMNNIRLTPENIATERDVIIEERNQRTENNPGALFGEQMNAAQYLNHRYGMPDHRLAARDGGRWIWTMRCAFYETYYSPNNAILVVSGDVHPDEVRALAEKYYGVIPANPDLPERLRTARAAPDRRAAFDVSRCAGGTALCEPVLSRAGARSGRAGKGGGADDPGGDSGRRHHVVSDRKAAVRHARSRSIPARSTTARSLDDTTFDLVVVPSRGVSLQEAEDAMDAALAELHGRPALMPSSLSGSSCRYAQTRSMPVTMRTASPTAMAARWPSG